MGKEERMDGEEEVIQLVTHGPRLRKAIIKKLPETLAIESKENPSEITFLYKGEMNKFLEIKKGLGKLEVLPIEEVEEQFFNKEGDLKEEYGYFEEENFSEIEESKLKKALREYIEEEGLSGFEEEAYDLLKRVKKKIEKDGYVKYQEIISGKHELFKKEDRGLLPFLEGGGWIAQKDPPNESSYKITKDGKKWLEDKSYKIERDKKKKEERKKREKKEFEENKKEEYKEIKPSELGARHIDKKIRLRGKVEGTKRQKALPRTYRCLECGNEVEISPKEALRGNKPNSCKCGKGRFEPVDYYDHSILFVRNLLEDMEKLSANYYESITVHLIGEKPLDSQEVELMGEGFTKKEGGDIRVLATDIKEYEGGFRSYEITEEDKENFKEYFTSIEDIKYQIAPGMAGRGLVRESRLLLLHSPIKIPDIEGEETMRGGLREIYFGDSTTYKSESFKDITNNFRLGEYLSAETSSRTGVLYTIDTERDTLRWGSLVLNDLGYTILDGMTGFHSEEMEQLREALRGQVVKVRQFKSGEAYCRTRISGAFNPKKGKKTMGEYPYNCCAIKDTYIFKNTPDIARWDIFIPFCDDDVSEEEIVNWERKERPIPEEVFKRHIFWVWNLEPEDIEYTSEAIDRIKGISIKLMNKYKLSRIPIVNNQYREVVTRISTAYASLLHSTNKDHTRVIVKKKHAEMAEDFIKRMLDKLELEEYKKKVKGEVELKEEDFGNIITDLNKTQVDILRAIELEGKSSKDIAIEISKEQQTVKQNYEKLKEHELIRTKKGVGVKITPKGIKILKKLRGEKEEEISIDKKIEKLKKRLENLREIKKKGEGEGQVEVTEEKVKTKEEMIKDFLNEEEEAKFEEIEEEFPNLEKDELKEGIDNLLDVGTIFEPKKDTYKIVKG